MMGTGVSGGQPWPWSGLGLIEGMIEGHFASMLNNGPEFGDVYSRRAAHHRHKGSDEELSLGNLSPPGSVDSSVNGPLTPSMVTSPSEVGDDTNIESSSGATKRKLSKKEVKFCSICGDTALGCNFDAISCESCKAFFRRNALKDKKTKCVFTGSCNIDINTRKFCPHCRLLKCFAVGMKKELILGVAEREKRRQKVQKNREVRGSGGGRKRARKSNGNDDTFSMVGSPMAPSPDGSGLFHSPVGSPLSSPVNVKVEPILPVELTVLQQQSPGVPEFVTLPPVSTIASGSPSVPPISNVSTLPPVSGMSPLPSDSAVTPLPPVSTVTPLPPMSTMSPLPPVSGVSPLPTMSTASPLPTMSAASPLPPMPTVSPLPPMPTVSPVPPMPTASPLPPMSTMSSLPTFSGFPLQSAAVLSMPPSPATSTTSQQSNNTTCNLLNAANYMQMPDVNEVQTCGLDENGHRQMTQEESTILAELLQIYDLSFTADLEPLVHINKLDPTLNQLVNQSSITVLRIIKFAKRLEEFVSLPQECQIGILKGTWIHILLLRSVSMYDCERDLWVTPRVAIPTEILKNATGYVQLHDDHVNYCKDIKAMIRDDITLITIMLVVVLFSPEGQHVTLRSLISNIQDKYLLLLKHYIEWKYGFQKAADTYPELVSKMKELKELAEVHGKYLLDVNPQEIEPIMLEILDLK